MNQIGAILNLAIGLVLLWIVYYFGWRPYRIDNVRHDLFELRNELFLYAAAGNIAYENEAYRGLRRTIEALIRFAHTMTFSRVLIVGLTQYRRPMPAVQKYRQHWQNLLESLPDSQKAKLRDIHNRVMMRVLVQMVTGNIFLLGFSLLCIPIMSLHAFFHSQPSEESALKVAKDLRVDLIEQQALIAQEYEFSPA